MSSRAGEDVQSVECSHCHSCWKQKPQKELSVPGAAGGIGPTDFPGTVCPVSLICFISEGASVGVSGMLSELRWLYLQVASGLGKEGIHTVLLWMSQLFPGVNTGFSRSLVLLAMTEIFVLLGLAKIPPIKSLLGSDLTDGPCEKEMLFFQESPLVPILLCHCCGHCMSLCEIPDDPPGLQEPHGHEDWWPPEVLATCLRARPRSATHSVNEWASSTCEADCGFLHL